MAFIFDYVSQAGTRTLHTFDGNAAQAASLFVQWSDDEPPLPEPEIVFTDAADSNQFTLKWISDPLGIYSVFKAADMYSLPGATLTSGLPAHVSGTNSYTDSHATNRTAFYTIEATD